MTIIEQLQTPERRAQAAEEQKRLQDEYGPRLAQNPAQANYLYGLGREQSAIEQLDAFKPEDFGEIARADRLRSLHNQLGEGLALQGRFSEAAEVSDSAPHRAEYLEKAEALGKLGESTCACPEEIHEPSPTDAKGSTRQAKRPVDEVFDAGGNGVITFLKCDLCGRFSAKVK